MTHKLCTQYNDIHPAIAFKECLMKNVTISLQEDLLKEGRMYARLHHTTLNALIRDTLARRVMQKKRKESVNEFFLLLDQANICSNLPAWKREDLYRV